jgi:DNA-binding MarR family transcriptional regulator
MDAELRSMIDTFLRILHTYSAIEKKPKDLGTGDKLYVSEIQAISMIGQNPEINLTGLADMTGVTRGAISQIVKRLISKGYIVKCKARNNKEINLLLSDRGLLIFQAYTTYEKEKFAFAEQIYDDATPAERDLVKRLFGVIYENTRKILDTF